MFTERNFTTSPVNVTQGERLSSDQMKGRVYTVNLQDLNTNLPSHKKIKLVVDEEQDKGSKVALTNFYGLDTTRDHLSGLIKKWHTLLECYVDAKTSDGFLLRVFVFAITNKNKGQQKATSYAQRGQIKQIRKIINAIVTKEVKKNTLKDLVPKLLNSDITEEITNQASKIFPVKSVLLRKVKTIKRPRFDSKAII